MTNCNVIEDWLKNRYVEQFSYNKNLHSHDNLLYSYDTVIAIRIPINDYFLILLTTEYYSTTTSRHIHLIKDLCDKFNIPILNVNLSTYTSVTYDKLLKLFEDRILYLLSKYKNARSKKQFYLNTLKTEIYNFMLLVENNKIKIKEDFKQKILKIIFCYDSKNYKQIIKFFEGN